ncbi:MAG: recombinase family protein [Methanomassiliicoccales archaeon]
MKVAIYLRVSTAEQAEEGFSIAAQRERLKAYVVSQGWQLAKEYEDGGFSGGTLNRPAFLRMMEDLKRREFDLILVYKLDRLSRNMRDLSNLVHEMDKSGIYFKSATEPFDTTTPAGKLIFNMLGSVAEFERGMIAERVKMGMMQKAKEGKGHLGFNIPYGYAYLNGKLEPIPNEASTIHRIYDDCLFGHSLSEISRNLNSNGTKTKRGREWAPQTVLNVLTNPIYAGYHRWSFIYWKGNHLPLMGLEKWNATQRILNLRSRTRHNLQLEHLEEGEFGVLQIRSQQPA